MQEPLNWQFNPDVAVRRRGVMEKCTFCIQRIRRAEEQAAIEGIDIKDYDFEPACAQACPSDAIVFGLLSDPNSQVSHLARNARSQRLLLEESRHRTQGHLFEIRTRVKAVIPGMNQTSYRNYLSDRRRNS